MSTLNDLIAERNQYREERATVRELVQDVFSAMSIDHEQGVAWMNEEFSAKWVRQNPCTHAALQSLARFVEDWDEEEA